MSEGQEAEFLASWHEAAARFAHAEGFVSTRLHRNTGLADKSFAFVNVAVWESVEAYRGAVAVILRGVTPVPGVTAHPGLFEIEAER